MTFGKRGIGALALFFIFIEFVEAVECGSIPGDGCSVTRDTVFFQGNYFLPHGIVVNADDVSLDCNGSVLNGEHSFQNGITIFRRSGVVIKNCNVANYERANLFVRESDGARIENNLFSGSEWNYGVHIYYSTKAELKNNVLTNNRVNLYIKAAEKQDYDHLIDETNLVNSKQAMYLFDVKNLEIDGWNLGHLEINFGENISIVNNDVESDGILLNSVANSFISSNMISESDVGLDLQNSDGNKIIGNEVLGSSLGIRAQESDSNLFSGNLISSSSYEGLSIYFSNNNFVENNEIINSKYYNLRIMSSNNNSFLNNVFSKAGDSGALIDGISSSGNILSFNNFEKNTNFNLINMQKFDISAENNWWGSINKNEVKKLIFDGEERKTSGTVLFEPFSMERN